MPHREKVPEYGHVRLDHRKPERPSLPGQTDDHSRFEREIKTKLGQLEAPPSSSSRAGSAEDIIRDVLEKVNRKQQLDWRLEKLQRGMF